MKKFLPIAIVILSLLYPIHSIYAEDSTSSSRTDAKSRAENKTERVEQKAERRIGKIEQKKETILAQLEERKEKIASRVAEFKEKIKNFKDKKKAEILERVSDELNRINKKRTEQMTKHLGKMTEILGRVEKRINESSASAETKLPAQNALSDAKTAIASASAAVNTQAVMDYTINISSESGARADAKTMRDKLHSDLKTTHNLVIDAKQAVANAIRVTASTLKGLKFGQ